MGSEDGHSHERPVHEVTIGAPFAVGRYEVTFAEWTPVRGTGPVHGASTSRRMDGDAVGVR